MCVFGAARRTHIPLHQICYQECFQIHSKSVFEMHNAKKVCLFTNFPFFTGDVAWGCLIKFSPRIPREVPGSLGVPESPGWLPGAFGFKWGGNAPPVSQAMLLGLLLVLLQGSEPGILDPKWQVRKLGRLEPKWGGTTPLILWAIFLGLLLAIWP